MRKQIIAAIAAAALSLPLMACNAGGQASTPGTGDSTPAVEQGTIDDELTKFFVGQWRASVEATGNTVYGDVSGKENMLDVVLEKDGSATVTPLEGHEDLLTGEGTWTATDNSAVTVTVGSTTFTLTVIDDATLEGNPADFGIDGFDVLTFEYY